MPLVKCVEGGNPGWKYGKDNKSCFTYTPGNKVSEASAKLKAIKQGYAISLQTKEKFKP